MKSGKVFRFLQNVAAEAVPDTVDLRNRVRAEIARRQAQRRRLSMWRNMLGVATLVFASVVLFAFRPAVTTIQPLQPSLTQFVQATVTPLGNNPALNPDPLSTQPPTPVPP